MIGYDGYSSAIVLEDLENTSQVQGFIGIRRRAGNLCFQDRSYELLAS
jgi:hypothetical protein